MRGRRIAPLILLAMLPVVALGQSPGPGPGTGVNPTLPRLTPQSSSDKQLPSGKSKLSLDEEEPPSRWLKRSCKDSGQCSTVEGDITGLSGGLVSPSDSGQENFIVVLPPVGKKDDCVDPDDLKRNLKKYKIGEVTIREKKPSDLLSGKR